MSVAQATALEAVGLKVSVPSGKTVTLSDTAAYVDALTATQITALKAAGVTAIKTTDRLRHIECRSGYGSRGGRPESQRAFRQDRNAIGYGGGYRHADGSQITALKSTGVTAIVTTDASAYLSVAQAIVLEAARLKVSVPSGDTVTLSDTAAHVDALTTTEITALKAIGVTAIESDDGRPRFVQRRPGEGSKSRPHSGLG